MKGYWLILGTEVTDPEAQAEYGRLWAPVAERHGARVIRDLETLSRLESRADTARMLLVEFPSLAAARACFDDPAYKHAFTFAHKAARRDLVLFEGDLG